MYIYTNIVFLLIFWFQYYTEKGAYNKANGLPPQLDGTDTLQTQTEQGAQPLLMYQVYGS